MGWHARTLTLALTSTLALLGCTPSGSATLTPERYDRECATVFDCQAVYVGPVDCCSIPCANTALNLDAVTQLTMDIADEVASKCQFEETQCPVLPICAAGSVECVHGACAYTPPARDGGAG